MLNDENCPVRFCSICGKQLAPFFGEGNADSDGKIVSEWVSLKCPEIKVDGMPAFVSINSDGHSTAQVLVYY